MKECTLSRGRLGARGGRVEDGGWRGTKDGANAGHGVTDGRWRIIVGVARNHERIIVTRPLIGPYGW